MNSMFALRSIQKHLSLQIPQIKNVAFHPSASFLGVSQGGILGGGYVAISPDIERYD